MKPLSLIKNIARAGSWCMGLLLVSGLSHADMRVNAAADFLLERAKANYTYIVEKQLEDNDYFKCFMPNTYDFMRVAGFEAILTMSPVAWRNNVEKDVNGILVMLLYSGLDAERLKSMTSEIRNNYLELVSNVQVKDASGVLVPINQISIQSTQEERDHINQFYDDINKALADMESLTAKVAQQKGKKCVDNTDDYRAFRDEFLNLVEIGESFVSQMAVIKNTEFYVDGIKVDEVSLSVAASVGALVKAVNLDPERLKKIEDQKDNVSKVIYLLDTIEDLINKKQLDIGDNKGYQEFKSFAILAAQMSEAESEQQIKAILDSFFMADVSFGVKREQSYVVTIQSYMGLKVVETVSGDLVPTLSVPVGFEYTKSINHVPFSLMLGLIDFAGPVNAVLTEEQESYSWDDLVAPKIIGSVGMRKWPVALNLSYDLNYEKWEGAVSFDMPLYRLF